MLAAVNILDRVECPLSIVLILLSHSQTFYSLLYLRFGVQATHCASSGGICALSGVYKLSKCILFRVCLILIVRVKTLNVRRYFSQKEAQRQWKC